MIKRVCDRCNADIQNTHVLGKWQGTNSTGHTRFDIELQHIAWKRSVAPNETKETSERGELCPACVIEILTEGKENLAKD